MEIILNEFQNPIESIKQVNKLFSADISGEKELSIKLDMRFVKPFAMCFIASSLKYYITLVNRQNGIIPRIIFNKYQNGCGYAANMGFFKFISEFIEEGHMPGELTGNSNYLPLTIENFSETHKREGIFLEKGAVSEIIAKKLSKVLIHQNRELEALFLYLLRELIRNIPEHAKSELIGYSAQYWPRLNNAEICVFDNGCGIYESLSSNCNYRDIIEDNKKAIELALSPGISEAFSLGSQNFNRSEWANSGYGLYFIHRICEKLKGSFLLMSKGDYIYQSSYGDRTWGKSYFDGTIIRIRLPISDLTDFDGLLKEIRNEAEAEAKLISNTYRSASKSSSMISEM